MAEREYYDLALANNPGDVEGAYIKTNALSYYLQNTTYLGNRSFTPGFRVEDVLTSESFFEGSVQENRESLSYIPLKSKIMVQTDLVMFGSRL